MQQKSDLTQDEWQRIAPLIPPPHRNGRPRVHDARNIINAIAYVSQQGCSWRALPAYFPPWQTVYDYLRSWRMNGTWDAICSALPHRSFELDHRSTEQNPAVA